MKKIVRNRIKCKKCGEIIESTSRHDFKFCKCGAVAVDGGKDYLRRVGSKEDYEELVEYEGSDERKSENLRFVRWKPGDLMNQSSLSMRERYRRHRNRWHLRKS